MNRYSADKVRGLFCLVACAAFACCVAFSAHTVQARALQQPAATANNSGRAAYLGDAPCITCHAGQAQSYQHTAHNLTSRPASRSAILGSFQSAANVLTITDPSLADEGPGLSFRMEAKPGGFYQTAVTGWPGALQKRTERIDLVIGSGVRGQSFLYWRGNALFELPVSFWTDGKRWINSPGYRNGTADFSRPVDPRCLECHATFIQPQSSDPSANRYLRSSLVTGIGCEVCHGPAAAHVAASAGKSALPATAAAIVNPAKLTRDRQVDMCALCHNGTRQQEIQPAFSFIPGQSLEHYLVADQPESSADSVQPNVHGDQVGLLKKSRCYQSSPGMSCSTCHDVHAAEKAAATYSSKCLNCHQVESCGHFKTAGASIAGKCVDCHMPLQTTTAIVSDTAGKLIRPDLRTHWIKVY